MKADKHSTNSWFGSVSGFLVKTCI